MNVGKAEDLGTVVVVSTTPLVLVASVWSGADHAEGTTARRAENPATTTGLDGRIHVRNEIGVGFCLFGFGPGRGIIVDLNF